MPFSRPTLTALRQQAYGDVTTNLAGADGFLRRSNLNVVASILAGLANLHYGYEDWIAMQAVPFTATDEFLQGWGALKGVFQGEATAASGSATFTGTNGVDCPVGTVLTRSDGALFTSTADAVVSAGSVIVPATAQVAGAAGNTLVGSTMTFSVAIPGINATGTVTTAFVGGADIQSIPSFRTEVLQRYAQPPQGGAVADYIGWALAVPGVTRAWCLPNGSGIGTVNVYTMFDVTEAAYGGFPQGSNGAATLETRASPATGDQLLVVNAIFLKRPVTALVYSVAPVQSLVNFTISNLSPNTTAIKASISAALTATFLSLGTVGGVLLPNGQTGGTIPFAAFEAAIDAIPGIQDYIITSPSADVVATTGSLSQLGTVSYV